MSKPRICFHARGVEKNFKLIDFYSNDIKILEELGYDVHLSWKTSTISLNCDVYYIWWWSSGIIPLLIAKFRRKPAIMIGNIHLQDTSIQGYYHRPFYIRLFIKFCLRFSDVQLTTSKIELDGIVKLGAKNPYFIYHAVDANKYKFSPVENREKFILCVSRFFMFNIKRKKLIELLLAFKKVHTLIPDYKLILVGNKDDDGFEYLMSKINEFNLVNDIDLPGFISEEEKLVLFEKCCLYLQPTEYEGFGMAIAENMATGSPIITSKKGAVEEIANGCVVFVDPNNSDEIADAIVSLINNQELRKELSEKGRLRIISSFQIENRKIAIEKLLNDIIKNKSKHEGIRL